MAALDLLINEFLLLWMHIAARVPDVVLEQGHTFLQHADLRVPLPHRLDQVAVGLLRLL